MSEVELYTIQSKFNQARTEYMALIESIQTDCLGNQMSTECQKAASLNADMQTYLLQMSNMIKNKSNSYTNQKELLAISNQLGGDMENLTTLEQEEADGQVLANMSYVHALTWTLATITIVWFLIRK